MGNFRSGLIYRYPSDRNSAIEFVDQLPNLYNLTAAPGLAMPLLEKGISQIAPTKGSKLVALNSFPAILISSSPHSRGTEWNPWHDVFEPDLGYIRYFGDAKKTRQSRTCAGKQSLA